MNRFLLILLLFSVTPPAASDERIETDPVPWDRISTEELEALLKSDTDFSLVNVLPKIIHDQMHIPGSINISIGRIATSPRMPADKARKIVFYCMGTLCMYSPRAARIARGMGYRNVLVYREGVLGWVRSGRPLASTVSYPTVDIPLQSARDLAKDFDALRLDIRPADHFARGHVRGSVNIDLELLHEKTHLLPKNRRIVLIDHKGKLTLTTGRYLAMQGIEQVARLDGGFNAWVKSGLPLDTAVAPDEMMSTLKSYQASEP
jgi:rhodanese-related sulfurtransferase